MLLPNKTRSGRLQKQKRAHHSCNFLDTMADHILFLSAATPDQLLKWQLLLIQRFYLFIAHNQLLILHLCFIAAARHCYYNSIYSTDSKCVTMFCCLTLRSRLYVSHYFSRRNKIQLMSINAVTGI